MSKMSFNSVAWCYDFLATLVFGKKLRHSQLILLDHVREHDRVLIIGGGSGWIINALLKIKNVSHIDYIEASERMLEKAKAIPLYNKNVSIRFILGDESLIEDKEKYDAVLACYLFDLFESKRLEAMIARLSSAIKNKGLLLVADFYVDESSPIFNKLLIKTMYRFFNYMCNVEAKSLGPFRQLLHHYGFTSRNTVRTYKGLILSEVYVKQ